MERALLTCGIAFAAAVPAHSAIVIDQNALNPTGFYSGFQITAPPSAFGRNEAGQVVTAGLSGKLARVDVLIGGEQAYSVRLSIRPLIGGLIDPQNANRLATFDLVAPKWGPTATFYSVTSVDLALANLRFAAGERFALTFESLGGPSNNGGWAFASAAYGGGNAQARRNTIDGAWGTAIIGGPQDFSFATYVDTSAVPEPRSWALMIVGLGLTGFAARKSRPALTPQAG